MVTQLTLPFVQKFLDENFAQWILDLQPKLTRFEDSSAEIDIPITSHIKRFGDIVCGQAISALADTTMVFACFSHLDRLAPVTTTTLDSQFMRPASGDILTCRAKVERAGKAVFFLSAELTTRPNDKLVARASATFYLPA